MKQRNHLLRASDLLTLDTWEQVMAPSAGEIIRKRQTAITSLSARLKRWVSLLSENQDEVELHYRALSDEASLKEGWKKMRAKEQEAGHTLLGPHRDDLAIQLSHKSAKHFSSEGQKRGCIAALRFAEWEQMAELLLDTPLLGIDDFGIQLDERRQELLYENLSIFSQVFLTSPHFKHEEFLASRVFHVAKGSINL
jgi:DNA replication and repair protein RecF